MAKIFWMVDLRVLLDVSGMWEGVLGALGGSREGVLGLRGLLGSCRGLWESRWEIEAAVMGARPWGESLRGTLLRRAAKMRLFWLHLPPVQQSLSLMRSWHSAYAFAVGADGYAVLGRTPNLANTTARSVSLWYVRRDGCVASVVPDCNRGHDLVLGPPDTRGGLVGQWIVASFERFNGTHGVVVLDGNLRAAYEMIAVGGGAMRVCAGSFDGRGYFCVYNKETCVVLCVEGAEVLLKRVICGRAVKALGAIFLEGTLYVVEEVGVIAVTLPDIACTRVCHGTGFTGAVCALEPTLGRHGLALIAQACGVVWWAKGCTDPEMLFPVVWGAGEDCSLAALDKQRFAIVGHGGRIRVVCSGTRTLTDDSQLVWQPPQQIKVVADPGGASCVAVLKADCSLMVWGAAELCHLRL